MMASATPARHPPWWVFLLLPLLHYASVKLTFATAVSPENEVVVWIPNSLLLAALLVWRTPRAAGLALLTFGSDVVANLPFFPLKQGVLLAGCNLLEVVLAWCLMARLGASPTLARSRDFGRFLLAGPLVAALCAALLAGQVLTTLPSVSAPYGSLVLLWWFGDALGLLIFTPLLLAYLHPRRDPMKLHWADALALLTIFALGWLVFSGVSQQLTHTGLLTPTLLLPATLYVAARFEVRETTLVVACLSLVAAWSQTTGHRPFGTADPHLMILHAQEFILTLGIIGMGFSIMLNEQRVLAQELEAKVHDRTRELEASNAQLAQLSETDALTGLANRRRFEAVLQAEWNRARRAGTPLAVLMLDVDGFKGFNDRYGHPQGDDCLRMLAAVLRERVHRSSDFVARYGGEEFVVIGAQVDAAEAQRLAEGLCQAIRDRARPHADSPSGVVTASIGVAVLVPGEAQTPETLVARADEALYRAKHAGRDRALSWSAPA